MPEATPGTATPQAGQPGQPPAGATASSQAGGAQTQATTQTPPASQAGDGNEAMTLENARELRRENQALRQRMKAFEDKAKAEEDAKLSETQKLQKQVADAEAEKKAAAQRERERTAKYEVMLAAQKAGIVDADAAYKLLDLDTLEFDEKGNPKGIDAALKELLKAKPYLAGIPATAAGAATNPAAGHATKLTKDDIKKMTPDEINRRWDEVQQVLSGA